MGIMEIAAPAFLCLGAILAAALLYGIVAAVKGRREGACDAGCGRDGAGDSPSARRLR